MTRNATTTSGRNRWWLCGLVLAAPLVTSCGDGMIDNEFRVMKNAIRLDRIVADAEGSHVETADGRALPLMDRSFLTMNQERDSSLVERDGDGHLPFGAFVLRTPPASYSLAGWQTGIRDQSNRRTCWIFGIVAAMEARYRRQWGVALDLSEQYFNHVAKSTGVDFPKVYKYENQSSYWGGGNSWAIPAAMTYAIPLETDAPYRNQEQMDAIKTSIPAAGALAWKSDPAQNMVTQEQIDAFEYSPLYIPMNARLNARYAVDSYTLLDGATVRDTSKLEGSISSNNEVIVDVDLKWKYDATTGVYQWDASSAGGGHCFLLIGYDRAGQWFLVKNSWNDASFLKVSYEFIRNAAGSGAIVNSVTNPNVGPSPKARWMGVWNSDHDGWKGKLVVRRVTNAANDATRLGSYYGADGKAQVVNGRFVDNNHGTEYFMSGVAENAPGTLAGQKFVVDQYSWSPEHASGTTWWNSTPFGVHLGRDVLALPSASTFSPNQWVGTWAMNHDGWKGTLTILAVGGDGTVKASYRGSDGVVRVTTGGLDAANKKVAKLRIAMAGGNQDFVFQFHSWEDRIASGYTTWAGVRYGAHIVRN